MILKLTGATFTENIGTVDLRTAPNASTQAILDYYGKTWTLQQQLAIEDFLTAFNAASWSSKFTKLIMPIFDTSKTITNGLQPKAFYDLISETIATVGYGGVYSGDKVINANGLADPAPTNIGANNNLTVNLGTPVNWNNVTIGAYWYKVGTDTNENIIAPNNFINASLRSDRATIGNSTKIDYTFDPNSISTRGLRIISYDGTNRNGLAASLPLASSTGTGTVDSSGDFVADLLSRYVAIDDVTISMLCFGTYMTQTEIGEFNTMINTLMDTLWS